MKPYTDLSQNPTQNDAQTLHCNGTQFYLGAHLNKLGEGKEKLWEGWLKLWEGWLKLWEG